MWDWRKQVHRLLAMPARVRPPYWVLLIVLVAGFAARYTRVDFGLPYPYSWDEAEITNPAIRVLRNGVYRPERFAYGPMNAYVHAAWGALTFIRGLEKGEFPDGIWQLRSSRETGWYWTISSPFFHREARVLSVLLGLLAIFAAYRTGVLLAGVRAGVWAAAMIALSKILIRQTSVISSDATSMAAAALALWASARILVSRTWGAYLVAVIMAALAAAFKYTNVVTLSLPLLAHLLSSRPPERRFIDQRLTWIAVGSVLMLSLFLFPVFIQPPRFLHDLSSETAHYGTLKDRGSLLAQLGRFVQQAMLTFDCAELRQEARAAQRPFVVQFYGIGFLLTTLLGCWSCARSQPRLLVMLLLPALVHIFFIGSHGNAMFARNLALSVTIFAVLSGIGWAKIYEWFEQSGNRFVPARLPRWVAAAVVGALLLLPMAVNAAMLLAEPMRFEEPRLKLSRYMLEKLPKSTRIAIMDEVRWFVTPEEQDHFRIVHSTIPQAIIKPITPAEAEYIVAPTEIQFYVRNPLHEREEARINKWLQRADRVVAFGSRPCFFGRPSFDPEVQLIHNDARLASRPTAPEGEIFGPAFCVVNPIDTALLGDGTLVVRPGAAIHAPVRVKQPATRLVVRARGRSPEEQKPSPRLQYEINPATTDTLAMEPQRGIISLSRSQSGMHDYAAGVDIKPGNYVLQLRAADEDGFLVEIESARLE